MFFFFNFALKSVTVVKEFVAEDSQENIKLPFIILAFENLVRT